MSRDARSQVVMPRIDVAVLHRPGRLPGKEVLLALEKQRGVRVQLRLHEGAPQPGDRTRWETIARARNQAKQYGDAPWFMFVDDDVVLASDCMAALLADLESDRQLAAVAADYDNELADISRREHVGMGATMFRRTVLDALQFRSTPHGCECFCACWDLRRHGYQIRYSAVARAEHRKHPNIRRARATPSNQAHSPLATLHAEHWPPGLLNTAHLDRSVSTALQLAHASAARPQILAAFDRRDVHRFEHQFLRSLRASGNQETVVAVAYGLYPSEQARLRQLDNVRLVAFSFNGMMPPVRRLTDFAAVALQLPPATPVAYWDVADVVFQDSLDELWQQVRDCPDRLLAVKEPKGYPLNQVIFAWSQSIYDPQARQQALELLKRNPFLNSGFAAGTAATMAKYFQRACRMRNEPVLAGTTDWGDQMALNIYCHSEPSRWREISDRWNYCVHDRPPGEVHVTPLGRVVTRSGTQISAAHGNARSLRQFALSAAIL